MIKELRAFIKFAEFGVDSIESTTASFISSVYSIENEINHKLIKYINKKNITLTNFGKSFLPYAKKTLQALEESINAADETNIYDADNQLTLGIYRDSASTWAINCIKNFNKMHPGLRLAIIADDSMTERMSDNATIIFWCINDGELLNFDRLWYIEYTYGLFASQKYIDQYGTPTLGNIKNHKIIAYSGKYNNDLTNWHLRGEYGLPKLEANVLSQSRDMIVKMVSEGLGIGAICDRQDVYYGYDQPERVIKTVEGPVFKNYFAVRKGLNEQMRCNVELLSRLFQKYFHEKSVEIKFV